MKYIEPQLHNPYVGETGIENLLIGELVPMAEGDFVKVYLYARFLASFDRTEDAGALAQLLSMDEARVEEAWRFWESVGAVRREAAEENGKVGYTVRFLDLRDQMFPLSVASTDAAGDVNAVAWKHRGDFAAEKGRAPETVTGVHTGEAAGGRTEPAGTHMSAGMVSAGAGGADFDRATGAGMPPEQGFAPFARSGEGKPFDEEKTPQRKANRAQGAAAAGARIEELMRSIERELGRTLSSSDLQRVLSWLRDWHMEPGAVEEAVSHCASLGKTSFAYIAKVIENWSLRGLFTAEDVRRHLAESEKRFGDYRRIMKALGFHRSPSEAEKKMMDAWFDELSLQMEKILEACAKTAAISNPNIKYVDTVLRNWVKEARDAGTDVNGKRPVSARVLNEYFDHIRTEAEEDAAKRKAEIYEKLPAVKDIDAKIAKIGTSMSMLLTTRGDRGESKKLGEEIERLNAERAILLAENNYAVDYTDIRYKCSICKDTGITDLGTRCSCVPERMREAGTWQELRKNAKN